MKLPYKLGIIVNIGEEVQEALGIIYQSHSFPCYLSMGVIVKDEFSCILTATVNKNYFAWDVLIENSWDDSDQVSERLKLI